jgi:hypothetical protein
MIANLSLTKLQFNGRSLNPFERDPSKLLISCHVARRYLSFT